MARKWKIICLVLFVTNALTIRWLIDINDKRSAAEEWLGEIRWGVGVNAASEDARHGQFRLYSIKLVPYPGIGHPIPNLTNELIGRTNGSLEIWTWPTYDVQENSQEKLSMRMLAQQLDGYNGRMEVLYQWHIQLRTTNASVRSNSVLPRP